MFRGPLKMLKPCNPKPFCLCLQGFASTLQIIRLECVASGVKHVTLQLEYAQLQLHYQGIFFPTVENSMIQKIAQGT
jgi:hypothetical protein